MPQRTGIKWVAQVETTQSEGMCPLGFLVGDLCEAQSLLIDISTEAEGSHPLGPTKSIHPR
jgi:hypothetical protein